MHKSLDAFLAEQVAAGAVPDALAAVLAEMAKGCAEISRIVAKGAIAGALGSAGSQNVQDEEQKKLDVITNDLLMDAFAHSPLVAGVASEELDTVSPSRTAPAPRAYLVLFDPLDGSSNIDVNVSVGTIFSILPAPARSGPVEEADFLQPGRHQVAAGYAVYGPQTTLVLTFGHGVVGFTLNPDDHSWALTHESFQVPHSTKEFAINMSNMRHWHGSVRAYIEACLAGKTGPRGKDFNMRWIASMVADVHRIMVRGGVFLYPWDSRDPAKPGKLRLMYEANPMSMLIEQAGGKAVDGKGPILDIQPHKLHQRVSVMLGAAEEIDELMRTAQAHTQPHA